MSAQRRRFWRITMMYHGTETLIADVPTTHITEQRLKAVIKMVFAKHTLTDEEILDCHLRSNVRRHRDLLTVEEHTSQDPISFVLGDGSNWVHAIVVRPQDQDAPRKSSE